MLQLARKTLETYLKEKRLLTQSDFSSEDLPYLNEKNAIFVTLYYQWKVIASQWRIQCKKENSLFECIDLTLACLKDPRFSENLQTLEALFHLQIRIDIIEAQSRRILKNISELNVRDEWIIFLSQNLGVLSVILPNMIKLDPTPEKYFEFSKQKAWINTPITDKDYVIYGLKTKILSEL